MNFKKKRKPQNPEKKKRKKNIFNNLYALFDGREEAFDAFESKIFPIKSKGTGFLDKVSDNPDLKILILKQMLQRLPIALAQVKAGNKSKNLLNQIIQTLYSFYRTKEITKKVYNNIMNSIKV